MRSFCTEPPAPPFVMILDTNGPNATAAGEKSARVFLRTTGGARTMRWAMALASYDPSSTVTCLGSRFLTAFASRRKGDIRCLLAGLRVSNRTLSKTLNSDTRWNDFPSNSKPCTGSRLFEWGNSTHAWVVLIKSEALLP